ncbi:Ovarian carcinoma immunoreactive antigen (OCIA) [Halocaridina rubra]|uniref:Ovarian carcinoma immunoreactive antigen (OCIA) n=1 Tax=Halocaridina rubra TaxID=373956 RepID=A0AAN8XER7_HALRR
MSPTEYVSPAQGYPTPTQQGYPPTGSPTSEQQFKPVFNQEELRVLRECNLESFYYRCVPMAAALSAAAFFAMKRGVLKTSERFGYTPKILGASAVGYFLGKFSYQNACAEKLMRLPDSPVGEALRKRKGRVGFQESLNIEPGFSIAMPSPNSEPQHPRQPIYDDHRPDFHNEGLDDYERGVTDSLTPYTEIIPSNPQQSTTYEELRRQNREEYVQRLAEKYRRPVVDSPPESGVSNVTSSFSSQDSLSQPPPPPPPRPVSPAVRAPGTIRKNQYGDDIYE